MRHRRNLTAVQKRLLLLLGVIAVISVVSRLLLYTPYGTTSVFYVGIPLLVGIWLVMLDRSTSDRWQAKYWNFTRDVFLILVTVSILLAEGFLCVLLFLPIYLLVMVLVMVVEAVWQHQKHKARGKLFMHWLPVLGVLMSIEGVHPSLSFDRENEVLIERVVHGSVGELMMNLERPIELQKDRHWFIQLFPMPYEVKAGTLNPGDVHEIHFRYHRWPVANTHEGRMLLEITEVGDSYVKTRLVEDTSYIGGYMALEGTEIQLHPAGDGKSRISLKVYFERKLDPAWYFGPLERYGVRKMGEFLIDEVVARND